MRVVDSAVIPIMRIVNSSGIVDVVVVVVVGIVVVVVVVVVVPLG